MTDVPLSLDRAFLQGWAQLWADEGLGVYRGPEGVFSDGEDVRALMPGGVLADTTTSIGLTLSDVGRRVGRQVVLTGLASVRLGRDLNVAADEVGQLVRSLHERRSYQLGVLRITQSIHAATAYLGPDGAGQAIYSLTFRFRGGDESRQPGLQPPTA